MRDSCHLERTQRERESSAPRATKLLYRNGEGLVSHISVLNNLKKMFNIQLVNTNHYIKKNNEMTLLFVTAALYTRILSHVSCAIFIYYTYHVTFKH